MAKAEFHDLDQILIGFYPSNLIILAARPSVGKTALALQMALHAARTSEQAVAFFSLEMSCSELGLRLLCGEARADSMAVRQGHFNMGTLMNAANRLRQVPLLIDDSSSLTVLDIQARTRRLQLQRPVALIVVDYLQLLRVPRHYQSRNQEITEISQGLKQLAKEFQIPVLALSQLNRDVEKRSGNAKPQLSDLRDSGCLSGDTLLRTATGCRTSIADLIGTAPIVGSYDTVMGRTSNEQCIAVFPSGVKPVFEISTGMGRTVRATANHRFWTKRGWVRVDRLNIEDHIGIAVMPQSAEVAQTLSDDELALIGHVIGNGCILPNHASQYTTRHEDLAHLVADLAARVFGADVQPRIDFSNPRSQSGWYNTFFSSTRRHTHGVRSAVSEWAERYRLFGCRSYTRRVPEVIFEQPEEAIQHFVRHLWVTDGCVSLCKDDLKPKIYYSTSSKGLARDVQSLLLRLGMLSSISKADQGQHRPTYMVRIVGGKAGYERFLALGTVGVYHQAQHVQLANRVHAICGWSSTTYSIEDGLVFDKIRAIEPCGDKLVFDATVPLTECMQANEFIAHNSIERDSDVVMFLHRPKEPDNAPIEISVAKQRNGPIGNVQLVFHKAYSRFDSLAVSHHAMAS